MSDLIDTVQLQEVGDSLVHLFELSIGSFTLYAFSGLEGGETAVTFTDRDAPYTVREYVALPMEISGTEWSSDGPQSRPTLAVANIITYITSNKETTLGAELEALNIRYNEDLLGSKIRYRRTLAKHLNGTGAPVEFPSQTYYLDRVLSENNMLVTFELASPFDIEGVNLPYRVVVGKYCPWKYKGIERGVGGGCTWNGSVYFDEENNPTTAGNDVCGKTLASCKARFHSSGERNIPLPFGGFPGVRNFK